MNTTIANHPQLIEAIYQEPSQLVLGVAVQRFPCQLTILKQETLAVGDWRFVFHIIGESHFVQVEKHGKLVLQELLACINLDPRSCTHYHHFCNLAPHRFRQENYRIAIDFKHRDKGYTLPTNAGMEVAFPAVHGTIPVTQIRWQVTKNRVQWWTYHLYPHETGVTEVRSVTGFNLI